MTPSPGSGQQMPPMGPTQSVPQPGGPGGGPKIDLPGVMQGMQISQQGLQMLAQALPPLAAMIAQFLTQLQQAVPSVIMAAGGGQGAGAPGAPPQGMPQAQQGQGGPGVGAPPVPPG